MTLDLTGQGDHRRTFSEVCWHCGQIGSDTVNVAKMGARIDVSGHTNGAACCINRLATAMARDGWIWLSINSQAPGSTPFLDTLLKDFDPAVWVLGGQTGGHATRMYERWAESDPYLPRERGPHTQLVEWIAHSVNRNGLTKYIHHWYPAHEQLFVHEDHAENLLIELPDDAHWTRTTLKVAIEAQHALRTKSHGAATDAPLWQHLAHACGAPRTVPTRAYGLFWGTGVVEIRRRSIWHPWVNFITERPTLGAMR